MASDGDAETRILSMRNSSRIAWRRSMPWLILGLLAAAVLGMRLQLSFDLSAFFPNKTSPMQDVLLEQFRNGPGSRLLVIGISGLPRGRLAELSEEMREMLNDAAPFGTVMNGAMSEDIQSLPEPIASYYLLMRDVDYSQESLHRALQERLKDLAFGGGSMLDMFSRDPLMITLDILEKLAPVDMSGDLWFADSGSAVLIAETRANAVDMAGQANAVEAIRAGFASIPGIENAQLEITGVGAFGVELQKTIRAETQKRSILASAALIVILFIFYRRPRLLLLATIPIGMGFLVGLAAVSLIFETVHGITLAFGFTLMGVCIDYPLHLFSHARAATGSDAMSRIWPTMRLGAASTAVAYLALALSGSSGLAQLGVFTATGILVALLVTRTWLPFLLHAPAAQFDSSDTKQEVATLRYLPALAVLAVVALTAYFVAPDRLWDDRLTSLSPVAQERLRTDADLRSATGASDMRYQIIAFDDELESLLQRNESLDGKLAEVTANGQLRGWQSVTQVLPSAKTQNARQSAIPDAQLLQQRLQTALRQMPFHEDAFESFADNASRARVLRVLDIKDLEQSALSSWLGAHILRIDDQWVSLISLSEPDPSNLAALVPTWDLGAEWMDLQQASIRLMQDYRRGAIRMVSIAAGIILLLLWYQRRNIAQIAWIGLTVVASLVTTGAFVIGIHGQLTVIHLVALLLVMGLGLDYALFLSRAEASDQRSATNHAVLACATSTGFAFSILAGSTIPVLKFLGLTVAAGSVFSYLLAIAGSRLPLRNFD